MKLVSGTNVKDTTKRTRPRSRPQPMHYSTSALTHYSIMHCTYMALTTTVTDTAIKIPTEPQHTSTFICTLRHGGSAEPALPTAELDWSERKIR